MVFCYSSLNEDTLWSHNCTPRNHIQEDNQRGSFILRDRVSQRKKKKEEEEKKFYNSQRGHCIFHLLGLKSKGMAFLKQEVKPLEEVMCSFLTEKVKFSVHAARAFSSIQHMATLGSHIVVPHR